MLESHHFDSCSISKQKLHNGWELYPKPSIHFNIMKGPQRNESKKIGQKIELWRKASVAYTHTHSLTHNSAKFTLTKLLNWKKCNLILCTGEAATAATATTIMRFCSEDEKCPEAEAEAEAVSRDGIRNRIDIVRSCGNRITEISPTRRSNIFPVQTGFRKCFVKF